MNTSKFERLPRAARVAGGGMPAGEEEAVLPGVAANHAEVPAGLVPFLHVVVFAVVGYRVVRRAQARVFFFFARQQ